MVYGLSERIVPHFANRINLRKCLSVVEAKSMSNIFTLLWGDVRLFFFTTEESYLDISRLHSNEGFLTMPFVQMNEQE